MSANRVFYPLVSLCLVTLLPACGDASELGIGTLEDLPSELPAEISPDVPIPDMEFQQKGPWDLLDPDNDGEWQQIEYVNKVSTRDFRGYGQHLQYFPAFGWTTGKLGQRTDVAGTVEYTPDFSDFEHHTFLTNRTFSPDALGDPIGVKTAGGYPRWDNFVLPSWSWGKSGAFYDTHACNGSNNSVNKIKINTPNLHAFCLNLITDNTNRVFNPNSKLEAKSDQREEAVPSNQLTFDGETDMYTFKYTGMEENDRIKINVGALGGTCNGPGLGGIMVSDISTCCTPVCTVANECGGDNGCGSPCPCTQGEQHSDLVPNRAYNIRNIWTRALLTGTWWTVVAVAERVDHPFQRWYFDGECYNTRFGKYCSGKWRIGGAASNYCLRRDDSTSFGQMVYMGSCDDNKAKWDMHMVGEDEVIGGKPFSGVEKFTMKHAPSNNNYLFAKARRYPLEVASRSNANRPPDHWIVELAQ